MEADRIHAAADKANEQGLLMDEERAKFKN